MCYFWKNNRNFAPEFRQSLIKRMIAASVSEGFCTLIHGWEGEFGLPILIILN